MKTGNSHIDTAADALIAVLQYQFPDQAERLGRAGLTVQYDNGGFIQLRTVEGAPATSAAAGAPVLSVDAAIAAAATAVLPAEPTITPAPETTPAP